MLLFLLTFFFDGWRMILTRKGVTVNVGARTKVATKPVVANFLCTARILIFVVIVNEWVRFGTVRFFWKEHANEVLSEMLENRIPWDIILISGNIMILTPTRSAFKIFNDAIIIIQNFVFSRLLVNIFHHVNFIARYQWQFSLVFVKIRDHHFCKKSNFDNEKIDQTKMDPRAGLKPA